MPRSSSAAVFVGAATPHAPPPRHARRRRHPSAPHRERAVGRPPPAPVTINWWHIRPTTRARACGRTSPTRTRRPTPTSRSTSPVLENEAFKTKLTTLLQAGDAAGPVPVVGRRRRCASRPTPAWSRTSRPTSRRGRTTINPGALSMYSGRRQAVRHPVRPRHGRLLVQQGPFTKAGITDAARDVGRLPDRRREAQGRGHHARSPSPARTPGPALLLLGVPRAPRVAARPAWTRRSRPATGPTRCFVKAGAGLQAAHRPQAVPAGLPRRAVDGAGSAAAAMATARPPWS